MRRDALRRRAIVAQNRLFSILSDVVRLVAVGIGHMQNYIAMLASFGMTSEVGPMQNYIAMLASFGMTSHRVAGPCDDLRHNYCELDLRVCLVRWQCLSLFPYLA